VSLSDPEDESANQRALTLTLSRKRERGQSRERERGQGCVRERGQAVCGLREKAR